MRERRRGAEVSAGVCAHDQGLNPMSYTLDLHCGCVVYVACHPITGVAHKRVIETRGGACHTRSHRRGVKLWMWELLPDSRHVPVPQFVTYEAGPLEAP
jgi:hypothetical protein